VSALLEIKGVTKRFGGLCAISDCNVSAREHQVLGVIGPNGAGKTTLFNLITGIYRPTEGEITYRGGSLVGLRPNRIAALGVARTFQNIRLFKELSVLDNIRIAYDSQLSYSVPEALLGFGRLLSGERSSIAGSLELLDLFGLGHLADQPAGALPYGLQRRVEIARALALKPGLLLLDEPAAGMNPTETQALTEFLRWVRDQFNLTIILIEHHMHLVMALSDRIAVLDFGVTIAQGTPAEIRADQRVIAAYLGGDVEK